MSSAARQVFVRCIKSSSRSSALYLRYREGVNITIQFDHIHTYAPQVEEAFYHKHILEEPRHTVHRLGCEIYNLQCIMEPADIYLRIISNKST